MFNQDISFRDNHITLYGAIITLDTEVPFCGKKGGFSTRSVGK